MPMYTYACTECGYEDDEFQRMADEPLHQCPECSKDTYRKQVTSCHTNTIPFHTPIDMLSIAMNDPEAIRDFNRRCPDVAVSTNPRDPNYGVPVAENRKQKLQALKAAGFVETN